MSIYEDKEISNLNVVIFAGGFGTRLMEHTKRIPKPLVKIGGKPILLHLIKHYEYYGFKNFIICLGYKGYLIKKYFRKKNFRNINIKFVNTGLKSLTALRLKKIEKYIKDDFFLTYGDGLSDIDIKKTFKEFKKINKIGLVAAVNPTERYGILKLNKNNNVLRFSEKPFNSEHWINGGFFIFKKEFLKYLSTNRNEMLERKPLIDLTKKKQLFAFKHRGFWKAMDTLRDKVEFEKIWKSGKQKWKSKL